VVTWLVIGALSAVVSLVALNMPIPGRSFILGTVDNGERASGLFKDPNVFGPFLIPIAVILLEQRVSPRLTPLLRLRAFSAWLLRAEPWLGTRLDPPAGGWSGPVRSAVSGCQPLDVRAHVRRAGLRRSAAVGRPAAGDAGARAAQRRDRKRHLRDRVGSPAR